MIRIDRDAGEVEVDDLGQGRTNRESYNMADQNHRDHKSLVDVVASGRITAEPDM